jgi:DNA methylase
MFPEEFVAKQIFAYTERGDTVFDPFCGRGTAVFESLLNGRNACGVDINPVAACVAGAKADIPTLQNVLTRLARLEEEQLLSDKLPIPGGNFFTACFHTETLQQVLFLRQRLDWKISKVDRFIAAVTLGCLHGESHKSQNCLSNRMPRTISTKPDYSVRWWSEHGYVAPARNAFQVLRTGAAYRLSHEKTSLRGIVRLRDARKAGSAFPKMKETVKLVVTSPPYLDTTDYQEDQWLRLWFLGGAERPLLNKNKDDRHTSIELYWNFLAEAWAGCAELARKGTIFVIRIGGTRLTKDNLMGGLQQTLETGLANFKIKPLDAGLTTEIKNRQTNAFRPGTKSVRYEHDFAFQLS